MKAAAIIAEYNPFHSGHAYHIAKTRELSGADAVVAIMSGSFVQGGEIACLDKWTRARQAVLPGGVDVVFELPFVFSTGSAKYFAKGATELIRGLGAIDFLSFGSECDSLAELEEPVRMLISESEAFKAALKERLKEGLSYPAARALALSETAGKDKAERVKEILSGPNNILAMEYLSELILHEDSIQPLCIRRKGGGHGDAALSSVEGSLGAAGGTPYAGARAIRLAAKEERFSELEIPGLLRRETLDCLKAADLKGREEEYYKRLRSAILTMRDEDLSEVAGAEEGLENKLKRAARSSETLEELISELKSKRYTRTAVKRFLCHVLMGLKKEELEGAKAGYARLLAFNDRGAKWLKYVKKEKLSSIAILSNINKELEDSDPLWELLRYDILSSDMHAMIRGADLLKESDYRRMPEKV